MLATCSALLGEIHVVPLNRECDQHDLRQPNIVYQRMYC